MLNSDLEALLGRVAALPYDTHVTYNDWHQIAIDVEQKSVSLLASTTQHALGDMLSLLSKGLNAIGDALALGNRHVATDLIEPLSAAILTTHQFAGGKDAMEMAFALVDELITQMSLAKPLDETISLDHSDHIEHIEHSEYADSAMMSTESTSESTTESAADRALTGVETIGALLSEKWDSEAINGWLFVIAQDADEGHLNALAEACLALAERITTDLDIADQQLVREHASLALLDAYAGESESISALLSLLDNALSEPLLNAMSDELSAPLATSTPLNPEPEQALPLQDAIVDTSNITDTANTIERQQVGRDMLLVLDEELEVLANEILQTLSVVDAIDALDDSAAGIEQCKDEQEALGEFLERLAGACDAIGLVALSEWIHAYTAMILPSLDSRRPSAAQREAMLNMAPALHDYCRAPDQTTTAFALVDLLALPCWTSSWEVAELEKLAMRLYAVDITETTADASVERPKYATPEDVSLDIPDDINAELLDGLIQELPVQTAAFSQAILLIATGRGALKDLDIAQRAAHTLKGAANTVGIAGIANLTHHLEDILVALHDAEQMPGQQIAYVLIEAGDCLETMSEAVQGIMPPPPDRLKVLQNVLDLANQIDAYGIPDDDNSIAMERSPSEHPSADLASSAVAVDAAHPAHAAHAAHAAPSLSDQGMFTPSSSVAAASAIATVTGVAGVAGFATDAKDTKDSTDSTNAAATIRVPASLIDDLLNLVSESIISASQLREQLAQSRDMTSRMRDQNEFFQNLVGELEHMVDIRGLGMETQHHSVLNSENDFDELEFERFNELQTLSRRLTEAATDAKTIANDGDLQLENFSELIEQHHRLQIQSQDLVMRTRMVPVATIEPRLQRSARQTSRLLDKEVVLEIEGGHTLMDSHVLQALVDPLMHIIRNAIDHGLEKPEEREALGKSPIGHLKLSFNREGNSLVVRCRDDGRGLDHAAIRHKAEKIGLITTDQELSSEEIARLILRHGFSTRDEASQISGRGIGMDAVLAAIHELKGALFLHNELGHGLAVELRMPVSLVASHALLVMSGNQVYALSTSGIHDLLYLDASDVLLTQDGQMKARVNDRNLRLTDFEELLCVPKQKQDTRTGFPVVIVQLDTGALQAVRLQAVHYSRDIVVKDLGAYVPRMAGLLGATILGDGNVAPVIDLRELATTVADGGLNAWNRSHAQQEAIADVQRMKAMIVDDSLSARRNTAQFMHDIGFDVQFANDGLDAVTIMEQWIPDIILTDMEMPRMNGLELTSYIRSQAKLSDIPVIMITSRSTDKHRRKASNAGVTDYYVKPYNEDLLIESVINLTHNQVYTQARGSR